MSKNSWHPNYFITPRAARFLMEIEAARITVDRTPLPPEAEAEMRHRARVRSTHYSTRIEGNRLTLAEVETVVNGHSPKTRQPGKKSSFHGRTRDVAEVRNYWNALLRVEDWAARKAPLTESLIRRLHALVENGPRAKPTPFRDGQNAVRDAETGALVYLPPEAKDVPALMAGLVAWVIRAEREGAPVPIIAGLAHYQFVTIHPYYDGNGRTARLLATFILHRGGYGLNGYYSLEEHHARDLSGYYRALATHQHHNYYNGRAGAKLTGWVGYFLRTLAAVFSAAQDEAVKLAGPPTAAVPEPLRKLDPRARRVCGLFAKQERITAVDVAELLGLSERMARVLLTKWVGQGLLTATSAARRNRAYMLSAIYRQYSGW